MLSFLAPLIGSVLPGILGAGGQRAPQVIQAPPQKDPAIEFLKMKAMADAMRAPPPEPRTVIRMIPKVESEGGGGSKGIDNQTLLIVGGVALVGVVMMMRK